jgi:uncharacterized protein YbaA (DUF1428 family)
MAKYVDGFVIPVPKDKLAAYKALAKKAAKVWIDHGALEVRETALEDDTVKMGVPFSKLTKIKEGQTVVFSWITYKSRAHRDKVNAKVMADPRIAAMCKPEDTPFDCKRMTYGGFEVIVAA